MKPYQDLANFINRGDERIFNDSLMRVVLTEISLKSGELNTDMILPRYRSGGVWYNGDYFERSATIKGLLPKKALHQAKALVAEGSKEEFKSLSEIKLWINKETGINDCSLNVI